MTLDGLEKAVLRNTPKRTRVNFIRYADDFIITGKSKHLLKNNIIPAVEEFLLKRGLHLSHEKTKITYIKEEFDFLGQNIRKHGRKLLITPSKRSVQSLIHNVGTTIVNLDLSPEYSLLVSNFYPFNNRINKYKRSIDYEKVIASSIQKQTLFGDAVSLKDDYLTTSNHGILDNILMAVYGYFNSRIMKIPIMRYASGLEAKLSS